MRICRAVIINAQLESVKTKNFVFYLTVSKTEVFTILKYNIFEGFGREMTAVEGFHEITYLCKLSVNHY